MRIPDNLASDVSSGKIPVSAEGVTVDRNEVLKELVSRVYTKCQRKMGFALPISTITISTSIREAHRIRDADLGGLL